MIQETARCLKCKKVFFYGRTLRSPRKLLCSDCSVVKEYKVSNIKVEKK